jgi:lipoprotein-anchoring transpeptidase ErfK/SrfK
VTGNTSLGRGTPQKVCYVYYKQRNRVLRGEDYETPVSYWMAVYGNIGIHDASWRSKFGGSIYKSSGSHGCINTPTNIVSQMYDMVEVGTPVIIFY